MIEFLDNNKELQEWEAQDKDTRRNLKIRPSS